MTETNKVKRRLKNFDFTGEGAHLALVHKEQGGAANGYETLLMKSNKNFTEETILKAQQIRVTMELDDFLKKFFHLWEDDAAVLAAMMGYKEEAEGEGEPANVYSDESFWCWWYEKCKEAGTLNEWGGTPESTDADYQEWLTTRMQGIEIVKSFKNSNVAEIMSTITEEQYLGMREFQQQVEKAMSTKDKAITAFAVEKAAVVAGKKATQAEGVEKSKAPVEANPAAQAVSKEENKMTVETIEVEKSKYEDILKASNDLQVELTKAKELITQFQEEKKQAIVKARKAELVAAVEAEDVAETLFKAVGELADEAFASVVEVVKALAGKEVADPMFIEKGVKGSEAEELDALTALLKSRNAK